MKKGFNGIFAVPITPFHKDGTFNYEAAKKHLDWLIENGVHGIVLLGATGEYQSVSLEEHMEYVRTMVPYIKDRVTVAVGASRERADDVVTLMENAKACGASAAMVLPPFYHHPTQKEIVEHYRYISEKVDLPLIIYNNPSSSVNIEAETFNEIYQTANVALVKESTGDIRRTTDLIIRAPKDTSVFCGMDNLAYEAFAIGADGWICVLANVMPKECVELYQLMIEEKNFEKGFELYKSILPKLNFLEEYTNWLQGIKHVISKKLDIDAETVRLPHLPISEKEKAYIADFFSA